MLEPSKGPSVLVVSQMSHTLGTVLSKRLSDVSLLTLRQHIADRVDAVSTMTSKHNAARSDRALLLGFGGSIIVNSQSIGRDVSCRRDLTGSSKLGATHHGPVSSKFGLVRHNLLA